MPRQRGATKKWICVLAVVLGVLSCSEAPVVEEDPTGRIVLAELFTHAFCVNCPFSKRALDSLSKEYGDSLAVIAYHKRFFLDTLSPADVAVRESLYQVTVQPTVIFDGINTVLTEDPSQNYQVYRGWIVSERNRAPQLRLHLETSVSAPLLELTVYVTVIDSVQPGDYHVFYVVYEDSVQFSHPAATDSFFSFVVRKMIPDPYGSSIELEFPDSSVYTETVVLDDTWDTDKLGVVAFVQEMSSHDILQAVVVKRLIE